MESIISRLRGHSIAKGIVTTLSAIVIAVSLAAYGNVSATPGTSSSSTSSAANGGSSTSSSPSTSAPSQQTSQNQNTGGSITDDVNAFAQAFKSAGFPNVETALGGVRAAWGPSYSYHIDVGTAGNNLWTTSIDGDGSSQDKFW